MLKFQGHTTSTRTKVLIGVSVLLVVVLSGLLIAQEMIDTKSYGKAIRAVIKEKTGRDVTIRGHIVVSLLPTPTIYVPGIELRDAPNDKPAPAVSIGMLSVKVSPGSIFSDQPLITGLVLERPVLELARARDNYIHWDWLNASLVKSLVDAPITGEALALEVVGGGIKYVDKRTDQLLHFEQIHLASNDIATMNINGNFIVSGHKINIAMNTQPNGEDLPKGVRPLHVVMDGGNKGSMNLKGSIDLNGKKPKVNGIFTAKSDDMLRWVKARAKILEGEQAIFDKLQQKSVFLEEFDNTPLPLDIKAEWSQIGDNIQLKKVQLEGLNSLGDGRLTLGWQKWYPTISAKFQFSGLDYNQWTRLFRGLFGESREAEARKRRYQSDYKPKNPIPEDLHIDLDLESEQLFMTSQIWKDFKVAAELSDASVTVNSLSVNLPGDSNMMVFGIISQGSTGGLRFEGSMETAGDSLRQMLTVFDDSAADLPETGFGDFFARANMFVSAEQVRLSEADVKLSDLRLNGGLVAYFDARPRLEADVQLKDINFDYFRDAWREKNRKTKKEEFFLGFDQNMKFSWLKKLQTNIDLKIAVNGFTFLERQGDLATFRIFVKPSEFGIYDMRFNYPYETLQASFNLNVYGDLPYINVVLNTNELDTDYFNLEPQKTSIWVRPSNTFKGIKGAIPPEDEMENINTFAGIDGAELPEDGVVGITDSFVGIDGARAPSRMEELPALPLESNETFGLDGTEDRLEILPQAERYMLLAQNTAAAKKTVPRPKKRVLPKPILKDKTIIKRDNRGTAIELWPEDLIDMGWMKGFAGSFDISVGRMIIGDYTLERLKMQAKLDNDLITFKNLAFMYWQGRCSILGSIYGGKVPGLSLSFTLFNMELEDMLKDLTGRTNIRGKSSVSGTLTTSGVNFLSWISQADAKMVFAGRGVNVDGINLQGVVDTLMVSRTAADVFNNVNMVLIKGDTNFTVDGNLNVKNGVMQTPGVSLRTGNITGVLKGRVQLVPWRMDISTLFQFPTITSETIPTMVVQNVGPIENTQIRTDTSSLEAYVAKRITSN